MLKAQRLIVLLLCLFLSTHAWSQTAAPAEAIRQGVSNIIGMLKNGKLTEEQRRSQLRDIIAKRFNFDEMSKRIMAQHWKTFSAPQKQQFISEFTDTLEHLYFGAINSYSSETVLVGGERFRGEKDATVIVTMQRKNNAGDIPLLFKLHRSSEADDWKIYDANVEGISLVRHYRERYGAIASKSGAEGVLQSLEAKPQEENKS